MPGPMIVGFTLVAGAWGLVIWRLAVEAHRTQQGGEIE